MTAPESPENRRFEPTIAAVALRLGVNHRTVAGYLASGAPAKTEHGYDVDAIENWRALNVRSQSSVTSDPEMAAVRVRRLIARTLYAEANARLLEHEVERTTEDVVHLDMAEQFLSGLFVESRRQLFRVPKQMGPSFPEAYREQIQKELERQLNLVVEAMHAYCLRTTELREA